MDATSSNTRKASRALYASRNDSSAPQTRLCAGYSFGDDSDLPLVASADDARVDWILRNTWLLAVKQTDRFQLTGNELK